MKSRARTPGRVLITAAALVAATALPQVAAGAAHAPGRTAASAVPHYRHIAVILMTDHGYGNIIGNPHAPTINALAKQYGLASRYFTTSDPDVADILALLTGKTFSVSNGLPYWDQQLKVPSLLSQLDGRHMTWKESAQSMPYPGYLGDCYPMQCLTTDTLYNQTQFNSVPDLSSVASNPADTRNMVPAAQLAADAKEGQLPAFSLIDPNECANMHGGRPGARTARTTSASTTTTCSSQAATATSSRSPRRSCPVRSGDKAITRSCWPSPRATGPGAAATRGRGPAGWRPW